MLTLNIDKNEHYIYRNVPYRVNHNSNFIVDLSHLSSVEDVKCNDGEAMDHHGQTLGVTRLDKDWNLTITITSKYIEEENDDEKWYLYKYVSRRWCKKYCQKTFFCTEILRRQIVTGTVSSNLIFLCTRFHLENLMEKLRKKKNIKAHRKTYKSTLKSLREISDVKKPKSAYETVRKPIDKEATIAALPTNYW